MHDWIIDSYKNMMQLSILTSFYLELLAVKS